MPKGNPGGYAKMPRKRGKPIPESSMIRKPGSRRPATWRQEFTGGPAKMSMRKRRSK